MTSIAPTVQAFLLSASLFEDGDGARGEHGGCARPNDRSGLGREAQGALKDRVAVPPGSGVDWGGR